MKGKLLVYRAGGSLADGPEIWIANEDNWHDPNANLERLRKLVEDDIEQVPYFDSIMMDNRIRPCVALCGEHCKMDGGTVNRQATMLWRACLADRTDIPESIRPQVLRDFLAGTVVILTGDPEFMGSL